MLYSEPDLNDPAYWRKPHTNFDRNNPPPACRPPDAERMRWLMYVIGWLSNELARRLDVSPSPRVIGFHCVGLRPEMIGDWLEHLAAFHVQHWPPPGHVKKKDFSPGVGK